MAEKVEKTPARIATQSAAGGEKEAKPIKVAKPKAVKVVKPKAPASTAGREKAVKPAKAAKAVEEKVVKEVEVKEVPAKVGKSATGGPASGGKVTEKYFYAVGRRKTSVAQVRLFEQDNVSEDELMVNGKKIKDFFPPVSTQTNILAPLRTAGVAGNVRMTVLVRGGGFTGQADAIRLGIARALVKMNEEFKKSIKAAGFLTRDSRKVERKKPGLKKARKAPQWAKR